MTTDAAAPMTTDETAIANLIARYAELVDAGDFEGLGMLFADATFRAQSGAGMVTFTGAAEVTQLMRGLVITYPTGTPQTRHVTTNSIIDVDDASGEATARSYFCVMQAVDGFALQPIVAGRYHDRFVRNAGGDWCFADRLIYSDLVGDVSRHLRVNPYEET